MVQLPEIEEFIEYVKENPQYTGKITEQYLNDDITLQINVTNINDSARSLSFSFLLNTNVDIKELFVQRAMCIEDVDERFGNIERTFIELLDNKLHYIQYEPTIRELDDDKYNIIAQDSIVIENNKT